ncbi:MAG: hypothetical protein NTW18_06135 [Candidatus Omnitrophica bacterium]|nr:hypothetical protein [Candidatus Omnitrophota bacterium]
MFEPFLPKKFCREFVEIKGYSGQLVMIMATIKGIKPCMDDWIPVNRLKAYNNICASYGLFVEPDTIFDVVKKTDLPMGIVGRERLTTTTAFGLPLNQPRVNSAVHVFVAKTKNNLDKALRNGWYPLIIKNRVIDKPLIDAFKFGHDLGYPACCVAFFRKYNNWNKYSHLYEILKNTPQGKHPFLCNPFTKDVTYSYIYHMPCSYDCAKTLSLTKKIRSAIYEEEPELVRNIDRHLKLPLLVFYERKFYAFEGEIKNKRIYYKNVYFIGQMPENNLYEADLKRGDCVFLEGKDTVILKRGRAIKRIKWQKKQFAPETPFIIQFN